VVASQSAFQYTPYKYTQSKEAASPSYRNARIQSYKHFSRNLHRKRGVFMNYYLYLVQLWPYFVRLMHSLLHIVSTLGIWHIRSYNLFPANLCLRYRYHDKRSKLIILLSAMSLLQCLCQPLHLCRERVLDDSTSVAALSCRDMPPVAPKFVIHTTISLQSTIRWMELQLSRRIPLDPQAIFCDERALLRLT
jgi:hypothetical protein